MNETKIIHVIPVGMDERKIAILRTAFRMHQSEHYEIVENSGQKPDLAIIDIDSPQGLKVLDTFLEKTPETRYLVTSVTAMTPANGFFLLKPLRIETLFPMLKQLRESKLQKATVIAEQSVVSAKGNAAITDKRLESENNSRSVTQKQKDDGVLQKKDDKREPPQEVFKPPKVHPALDWSAVQCFDADRGLLGAVRKAVADGENAVIFYRQKPLLILLPNENIVYLSQPLGGLQELCPQDTIDDSDFELRIVPMGKVLPKLPAIGITNLLWQLAIWSANGRLEAHIRRDRPLILKSWPNFTRVARIPESMRITAFLMKTPVNIAMLHKLLQVDAVSLFNFLAAVYVTDFLITDFTGVGDASESQTGIASEQQYSGKREQNALTQQGGEPDNDMASAQIAGQVSDSLVIKPPETQSRSFLQKLLDKLTN